MLELKADHYFTKILHALGNFTKSQELLENVSKNIVYSHGEEEIGESNALLVRILLLM